MRWNCQRGSLSRARTVQINAPLLPARQLENLADVTVGNDEYAAVRAAARCRQVKL